MWEFRAIDAGGIGELVMTTIQMTQDRGQPVARPVQSSSAARQVLLACGLLSSLLYVATDFVGGLRYPGYSFFSQAISELMAIGAASKSFVDPLFMVYNLLALLFGVGVLRAAGGRNRALRTTGAALIGYGAIGMAADFVGPYFAMQQRGAGNVATDAPHIILTGALVSLLLVAIGFSAFALGKRFRAYSLATFVAVIAFGALTVPFAARIASGQPTPGLGIIERIDVYSALLWMAVLSIALLQGRNTSAEGSLP